MFQLFTRLYWVWEKFMENKKMVVRLQVLRVTYCMCTEFYMATFSFIVILTTTNEVNQTTLTIFYDIITSHVSVVHQTYWVWENFMEN